MSNKWEYFYGIAAEDLDTSNPKGLLKVFCVEKNPFYAGNLEAKETVVNFTAEDVWGTKQSSKATTSNTVPAEYMDSNSGVSMPDIVAGEQLMLQRYCNQDKYYWKPFLNDDHLRLREHYRIYCSNSPTKIKTLTDDNTYFFEINTKSGQKGIKLSTSKSDGEAFKYSVHIDTEKSTVTIKDDAGNIIQLNSNNSNILLQNSKKTKVELAGENLFLMAENVSIIGRKSISTKSPFLSIDHAKGLLKVIIAAIKNCGMAKGC